MAEAVVAEVLVAEPLRVAVADTDGRDAVLCETVGRTGGGQRCGRDRCVAVEEDHAEIVRVGAVVAVGRIGDRGAVDRVQDPGSQAVAEDDVGAAGREAAFVQWPAVRNTRG